MEFFRIANVQTTEELIQNKMTLEKLEEWTNELILLDPPEGRAASIGGIWGEFTLSRDEVKGGLRFALVECPNALAWTVTTGYPPARESIVIHMTINRERKQPDFLEDIYDFLDDYVKCLEKVFAVLH
jgi:hypothetical protein